MTAPDQSIRDQHLLVIEAIVASTPSWEARAMAVASYAHHGQLRKYTNAPYFSHLMEVRNIVASLPGHSLKQRIGGLLHDIVEDVEYTGVYIEDIRRWFGKDIAEVVGWLSDVSKPEDGSRAKRKAIDLAHTAQAPGEVQTIKLADIISNTRTVVEFDPKFAAIYLPEKKATVEALRFGDPSLRLMAAEIIDKGLATLQSRQAITANVVIR